MTRFSDRVRMACLVLVAIQACLGLVGVVGAEEAAAPAAAPDSTVWVILKAVLPVLASQLGPLLTKGVSLLVEGVPGWLRPVLSVVIGSIASAVTGVETGMPVEAAASVGVAGGAAGHALMQAKPIQPAPVS